MQISPTAFAQVPRSSGQAESASPPPKALQPVIAGAERPLLRAETLRPAPPDLGLQYLGDYLRSQAHETPKDEDFALIYRGDQLVARVHNSGAATLYGVDAPADWRNDTSGLQGPAEAQRRADQFKALGYRTVRADTALSEDAWKPPATIFDTTAFEAYVQARRAQEGEQTRRAVVA